MKERITDAEWKQQLRIRNSRMMRKLRIPVGSIKPSARTLLSSVFDFSLLALEFRLLKMQDLKFSLSWMRLWGLVQGTATIYDNLPPSSSSLFSLTFFPSSPNMWRSARGTPILPIFTRSMTIWKGHSYYSRIHHICGNLRGIYEGHSRSSCLH
uniref:Uncharacterized protein n=1 Tax=Nelumbo nucifera TaxID=4432 RepID=A0A822YSN0_NELNU|nr:TPA_asm: hypothetical protein HUJ06_004725 [Nelumbo nucifera]